MSTRSEASARPAFGEVHSAGNLELADKLVADDCVDHAPLRR
jgi:hypothetical protein